MTLTTMLLSVQRLERYLALINILAVRDDWQNPYAVISVRYRPLAHIWRRWLDKHVSSACIFHGLAALHATANGDG